VPFALALRSKLTWTSVATCRKAASWAGGTPSTTKVVGVGEVTFPTGMLRVVNSARSRSISSSVASLRASSVCTRSTK
jgi:hypothetical protein